MIKKSEVAEIGFGLESLSEAIELFAEDHRLSKAARAGLAHWQQTLGELMERVKEIEDRAESTPPQQPASGLVRIDKESAT